MDALGDLLEPYTDVLSKLAGGITCLQFLSALMLLNDIRKRGISDPYPPEPLVGGCVLTILTLKLGTLMGDQTMINVNIFGLVINIVFVAYFYWYASNEFKTKIWTRIGVAGVFLLVCLAYANFEDPEKIEVRFGMLITAILVALVGSPLLNLGEIIKRKSTDGMPFPLIASGTLVAASWALYGVSIKNQVMVYQNMLLLFLGSIQLSLFAIYPNTPIITKDSRTSGVDKKKD